VGQLRLGLTRASWHAARGGRADGGVLHGLVALSTPLALSNTTQKTVLEQLEEDLDALQHEAVAAAVERQRCL
jgi:hypothetical protein